LRRAGPSGREYGFCLFRYEPKKGRPRGRHSRFSGRLPPTWPRLLPPPAGSRRPRPRPQSISARPAHSNDPRDHFTRLGAARKAGDNHPAFAEESTGSAPELWSRAATDLRERGPTNAPHLARRSGRTTGTAGRARAGANKGPCKGPEPTRSCFTGVLGRSPAKVDGGGCGLRLGVADATSWRAPPVRLSACGQPKIVVMLCSIAKLDVAAQHALTHHRRLERETGERASFRSRSERSRISRPRRLPRTVPKRPERKP